MRRDKQTRRFAGRGGLAAMALAVATVLAANPAEPLPVPRIAVDTPEWRELMQAFARQPDLSATFEERRFFQFRKDPIVLHGVARVSRERGLSLHYSAPEERVVILDAQGVLVRDAAGKSLPSDPRAEAANRALLQVLRLDLAALEKDFDLHGARSEQAWTLALVPQAEALRRSTGTIHVSGEGTQVRGIELRRSARQRIEINLTVTDPAAKFGADDVARYFR